MILSTVPGIEVLGCTGIRVISKFSSAIRVDFAMRGFAISFLTLACRGIGFFPILLVRHGRIMKWRWNPRSPVSHLSFPVIALP